MNTRSQKQPTVRQAAPARAGAVQRQSLWETVVAKLFRRKKKNEKTIYPLF
ncbi:hypothetical protein [Burkholderia ubonensis]|uniref:hypothetical protein n=1 Tax=Burkholderia ubonensis TaxID=101571 RepID=UPI000A6D3396|nr:hypothetical protein [Burkholderia ubonensis]